MTSDTQHERVPEQLTVELSSDFYQAILDLIKANEIELGVETVFELLESHLSETVAQTISEATGIANPFPQGVEVDVQIAADEAALDDDDEYVRASIKQGLSDIAHGDILTEAEFWEAVSGDE